MASRKDGKGRVLRKGEHYRRIDGRYSYIYRDPMGKQRTVSAKALTELRKMEEGWMVWICILLDMQM